MRRSILVALAIAFALSMSAAAPAGANHWRYEDGHNVHWADSDPSFPRGYVYWADRTGAEWPVYSAAVEWDKASKLDAIYVGPTTNCPSEPHCVSVTEAALGTSCSPTLGRTDVSFYVGTGHLATQTLVKVNSACSSASAAKRRTIVCHELGHSLGLGDQPTTSEDSCMLQFYVTAHTLPSTHDYQSIAAVYNHND